MAGSSLLSTGKRSLDVETADESFADASATACKQCGSTTLDLCVHSLCQYYCQAQFFEAVVAQPPRKFRRTGVVQDDRDKLSQLFCCLSRGFVKVCSFIPTAFARSHQPSVVSTLPAQYYMQSRSRGGSVPINCLPAAASASTIAEGSSTDHAGSAGPAAGAGGSVTCFSSRGVSSR